VGANVFSLVAKRTGDKVRTLPDLDKVFLNESYPGVFHTTLWAPQPIPNTKLVVNGRSVLPDIKRVWGSKKQQEQTVYSGQLEVPWRYDPPQVAHGKREEVKYRLGNRFSVKILSRS
jgi:acid phosphatase